MPVYHDPAYDLLKAIYQGKASQDDYHHEMAFPPIAREHVVEYLENHDERRVASPIVLDAGPDDSGFGSAEAGFHLAPLQYLSGSGPVLLLNGQEVGEPGAQAEGYQLADGRTTIFDYWAMPEFVKWVNGHRYDGALLTQEQKELRSFYGRLTELLKEPAFRDGIFYVEIPQCDFLWRGQRCGLDLDHDGGHIAESAVHS